MSSRQENVTTPLRQTKSLDSFNILHMFNNNNYNDFKTANKHIFIPSFVVSVISQNPNVTKLNCTKCDKENQRVKKALISSFFTISTMNILSSNVFHGVWITDLRIAIHRLPLSFDKSLWAFFCDFLEINTFPLLEFLS